MTSFAICIGNYGYYAEGELRDKWISLPVSDVELADFIRENGLKDAEHEEIYISDVECPEWSKDAVLRGTPEMANLLAKLYNYSDVDDDAMECVTEYCGRLSVFALCNVVAQADEICFTPISTRGSYFSRSIEEAIGLQAADDCGITAELENMGLAHYFDYKSYGRDCMCGLWHTDAGFMQPDDMPATDFYTIEELQALVADGDSTTAQAV